MKKIVLTLALILFFAKSNYSQTLMCNLFANSPATCTTCCDGSFTITPTGCIPGTYSITASAPNIPNLTANGFEYTNVCYGVYVFTLTSNSCPSGTISYSVGYGTTTNIEENFNQKHEFRIFPNPTTAMLNISTDSSHYQNKTIQVVDYLGQVVFTSIFSSQINLHSLSAGFYFLTIGDISNNQRVKVIKQ